MNNIIDGEMIFWFVVTALIGIAVLIHELWETHKYNKAAKERRERNKRRWEVIRNGLQK